MAKTRVKLDSRGVRDVFDQWATNDGARRIERAANAARSAAPVATGAYQASIRVERVQTDRPVWRVVASAPHALVVEARTGTLARALNAAGGA